ncbi:F-box domain-containing protein [Colletotrichum musicola]|uniref:F-box domain-containing protein n=1 Tax=Colletotrichum musicola TaxID=2175873 RepID=A0A8H6NU45_9PEZI|nr:F-box domain-containing protein [Colletotrichum musicola]
MASESPQPTWPPAQVPVEIFDEITTYLSRSDVKNLRLVNHEFDRMVSANYFRNVVVPFRSEMYRARRKVSYEGGEEQEAQACSDTLLSSGMRIFQSFGEHILRFALSLELDEETLAYPPVKPTQKAVTSYWGIYRWPHESYLRYTELEGLEQTADETASMKEALAYLSKVRELGLCCDAGLGYLLGPDQQPESAPSPHPVFGLRYKLLQHRSSRAENSIMNARKLAFENPRDFKYTVLESMVRNAGFGQGQIKDAISMLLSTENVSLMNIDFDERTTATMLPGSSANPVPNQTHNANANANVTDLLEAADGDEHAAPQRIITSVLSESASSHPLQPKNLTRAQKEMLLELEWAHRALIQSYVIALIDNASTNSFSLLTTLTIAKIPSSHIFMFQRSDFWQSLPNLTNVALAVVADWRQVAKVAPGCVEDSFVSPVEAVAKVHRLLFNHIAKQPNITYLHFEWVCGGEFAPGITQRNQFVLPAPLCLPTQMVRPATAKDPDVLLSLPYIRHLSFKNCYSTPHVFLQFIRTMALESLKKLELETVSLTGIPTRDPGIALMHAQAQPHPHAQAHVHAAIHHQFQQLQQGPLAQANNALHALHPPPLPLAPLHPLMLHAPFPPPNVFQLLGQQPAVAGQPPNQNVLGFGNAAPGLIGPPIQAPAVVNMAQIAQQFQDQPPAAESNWAGMRLRPPKLLTWAGIIERLAPASTIRDLTGQHDDGDDDDDEDSWMEDTVQGDQGYSYIPRPRCLISDKPHFAIEQMSFKSCGYVLLDVASIDNHNILPINPPWQEPQDIASRRRELAPFMQNCSDRLATRITNFMPAQEQFNLATAYGMDYGWTSAYDREAIEAARRDGILIPGKGRFNGIITRTSR